MSSHSVYQPRYLPRYERRQIRGLNVNITRWGEPAATPWVFLHGFLDNSATFQFLVDAFPEPMAVAAPDWRGFGDSDWAPQGYWFPDYLADLDVLLDGISPNRPAVLVGHSMGGNIATLYAGVRPERVRAVVSLEGFGLPRTSPDEAPVRLRRWLAEMHSTQAFRRYADLAEFAAGLQRRQPFLSAEQATYMALKLTRPSPDGGVVFAADPAHRGLNPVLYRREEAQACWRACTAPVLMMLAQNSEFRQSLGSDAEPEVLQSIFPNLQVATIADAGHQLHQERATQCAALIAQFLKDWI